MNDLAKFYEESLYPLQDGVLKILRQSGTPFFLTGGTALSRCYIHHRYSDDLDFFVCREPGYADHVDTILRAFITAEEQSVLRFDRTTLSRGEYYTQLYVSDFDHPETELKIEFINDVAAHYGSIITNPELGRVDSLRNILSNKLTALFRSEPKDVVDICAIAKILPCNWKEIVMEAKSKESGADPEILYDILQSFPLRYLDTIKWITKPDPDIFKNDLETIANDVLLGKSNSLAGNTVRN